MRDAENGKEDPDDVNVPDRDAQLPEKPYQVGYGKPPLHSRFKPGQSGNPKGRGKGTKNLKTILQEVAFDRKIKVTRDGKSMSMTPLEVTIEQMLAKAMKGDLKAADRLLSLLAQHGLITDAQAADAQLEMDAIESEILTQAIDRAARLVPPAPPPDLAGPVVGNASCDPDKPEREGRTGND